MRSVNIFPIENEFPSADQLLLLVGNFISTCAVCTYHKYCGISTVV